MPNTLILYDGKMSSTERVAESLGQVIGHVRICEIQEGPESLEDYEGVCLVFNFYGALTAGKTRVYLEEHKEELRDKRLAFLGIGFTDSGFTKYCVDMEDLIGGVTITAMFIRTEKQTAEAGYQIARRMQAPLVRCGETELMDRIEAFIDRHNTLDLAVSSENFVRLTPLEYIYIDGEFYIITEGGLKFRGLLLSESVSCAIYDRADGAGIPESLQMQAKASIIERGSAEYWRILAMKGLGKAEMATLPVTLFVIKITPQQYAFLSPSFRDKGMDVRQTLDTTFRRRRWEAGLAFKDKAAAGAENEDEAEEELPDSGIAPAAGEEDREAVMKERLAKAAQEADTAMSSAILSRRESDAAATNAQVDLENSIEHLVRGETTAQLAAEASMMVREKKTLAETEEELGRAASELIREKAGEPDAGEEEILPEHSEDPIQEKSDRDRLAALIADAAERDAAEEDEYDEDEDIVDAFFEPAGDAEEEDWDEEDAESEEDWDEEDVESEEDWDEEDAESEEDWNEAGDTETEDDRYVVDAESEEDWVEAEDAEAEDDQYEADAEAEEDWDEAEDAESEDDRYVVDAEAEEVQVEAEDAEAEEAQAEAAEAEAEDGQNEAVDGEPEAAQDEAVEAESEEGQAEAMDAETEDVTAVAEDAEAESGDEPVEAAADVTGEEISEADGEELSEEDVSSEEELPAAKESAADDGQEKTAPVLPELAVPELKRKPAATFKMPSFLKASGEPPRVELPEEKTEDVKPQDEAEDTEGAEAIMAAVAEASIDVEAESAVPDKDSSADAAAENKAPENDAFEAADGSAIEEDAAEEAAESDGKAEEWSDDLEDWDPAAGRDMSAFAGEEETEGGDDLAEILKLMDEDYEPDDYSGASADDDSEEPEDYDDSDSEDYDDEEEDSGRIARRAARRGGQKESIFGRFMRAGSGLFRDLMEEDDDEDDEDAGDDGKYGPEEADDEEIFAIDEKEERRYTDSLQGERRQAEPVEEEEEVEEDDGEDPDFEAIMEADEELLPDKKPEKKGLFGRVFGSVSRFLGFGEDDLDDDDLDDDLDDEDDED